jgi:hypothetical protein
MGLPYCGDEMAYRIHAAIMPAAACVYRTPRFFARRATISGVEISKRWASLGKSG